MHFSQTDSVLTPSSNLTKLLEEFKKIGAVCGRMISPGRMSGRKINLSEKARWSVLELKAVLKFVYHLMDSQLLGFELT